MKLKLFVSIVVLFFSCSILDKHTTPKDPFIPKVESPKPDFAGNLTKQNMQAVLIDTICGKRPSGRCMCVSNYVLMSINKINCLDCSIQLFHETQCTEDMPTLQ